MAVWTTPSSSTASARYRHFKCRSLGTRSLSTRCHRSDKINPHAPPHQQTATSPAGTLAPMLQERKNRGTHNQPLTCSNQYQFNRASRGRLCLLMLSFQEVIDASIQPVGVVVHDEMAGRVAHLDGRAGQLLVLAFEGVFELLLRAVILVGDPGAEDQRRRFDARDVVAHIVGHHLVHRRRWCAGPNSRS